MFDDIFAATTGAKNGFENHLNLSWLELHSFIITESTRLEHDLKKLDFHFNASFTALNLAKLEAHRQQSGNAPFVFSRASVKRRALIDHLLDTFVATLDLSPNEIKSHPNYQNLRSYGVIAA